MALTWDSNYDWSSSTSLINESPYIPILDVSNNFNIEADRIPGVNLIVPVQGDANGTYYLADQALTEAFVNNFYNDPQRIQWTISLLETAIGITRPKAKVGSQPSAKWIWWMKEALDLLDASVLSPAPSGLIIDGYAVNMFTFPETFTPTTTTSAWDGSLRKEDPGSIWGAGYDIIYSPQMQYVGFQYLTDAATGLNATLTTYLRPYAPKVYYVMSEGKWYMEMAVRRFGDSTNMTLWYGYKVGDSPLGTYTRSGGDSNWPTLDLIEWP